MKLWRSARGPGRALAAGLGILVLAGSGCSETKGPRPITDVDERFLVRGASVRPPRGALWYVGRRDPVYLEFFKDVGRQGLHTMKASLWAESLENPLATGEALSRFIEESTRADFSNSRYAVKELQVAPELGRGAMCDRLRFAVEDRGAMGPVALVFVVQGWEVFCVHPESQGHLLVRLGTSQRFLVPSQPLDSDPEVAPMLESLRFTPVE